jgi:prepilin-type N-terminal cleavage/methylation domain-containing protein
MSNRKLNTYNKNKGFTLIEVAMVLIIFGLMLATLMPSLYFWIEKRKFDQTNLRLAIVKDALINFSVVNQRLPCPATANSKGVGMQKSTGECELNHTGFVPAMELGLSEINQDGFIIDGWGNPIKYAVTDANIYAYVTKDGVKNNLTTGLSPDLGVTNGMLSSVTLVSNAPVIIYSSGRNGIFESHSSNNPKTFVYHEPTVKDSQLGEFDDQVLWISNTNLIGRMAQTW